MSPRFPRIPLSFLSVPCAALLGGAQAVRAQVVSSDWNTGNGQWHLPENWAPAEVPGNAGGRTYLVQIGSLPASAGAQVNLVPPAGGGVTIAGLTLTGTGTTLSTNGSWLSVSGQTSVEGASTLALKPVNTPVALETGTLVLTGQGTLDLMNGAAVKGLASVGPGAQITGEGLLYCGNTDAQIDKALDNNGRILCRSHSAAEGLLWLMAAGSDTLDLDGADEAGIVDVSNTGAPDLSDVLTLYVESPLSDAFSGKLIVGQRDTILFNKDFALSGADITLTGGDEAARIGGTGKITSATGTTFRVSGRGVIANDLAFSGAGNKVLLDGAGAGLDLRGAVSLGGDTLLVQGGGRLDFSGGLTVNGASGLAVTGTVSLDGTSGTKASVVNVNAPLSLAVDALDAFGKPGFQGADILTVDHRDGGLNGLLNITLPHSVSTWSVAPDGLLRLRGNGTFSTPSTLLVGAGVRVEGLMEVTGGVTSLAQIIVPAGGVIDLKEFAASLRLGGGAAMEGWTVNATIDVPAGTNRLEGGTIKGLPQNQLVVEANKALTGYGRIEMRVDARNATVLADGGTLTLSHETGPITGARLLGATGPGSVLEIPAAWGTGYVTEMWLGGGELRGGVLAISGNSQLSGFGLISMPLTVYGGLIAMGGTLVVADGGNSNFNNGRLRALLGTLEIRGGAGQPRFLKTQMIILQGGTVFFNGMAVNMQPGSNTEIVDGGVLRSNQPLTLGGVVSAGNGPLDNNALVMEGDALLDFGAAHLSIFGGFHITARRAVLRAGTVGQRSTDQEAGSLVFERDTGVRVESGITLDCIVENHGRMELDAASGPQTCHLRDLRLKAGSVLSLPLCSTGPTPCVSLTVENVARLDGTLELTLVPGYVPQEGDRSDVLFAGSGIIGKFSRIVQPPGMPPGLMFVPDVTFFPDVLHLTATVTTPYELWRKMFPSLTDPESYAKGADPDGDGLPNIGEFALHGNPSGGPADTLLHPRVIMVNGGPLCICTLPVRTGTVPDPNDPPGGPLILQQTADGLHYSLQASADLLTWNTTVTELTGTEAIALNADLPPLDNAWEYRTFAIPGEGRKYLRVVVTE